MPNETTTPEPVTIDTVLDFANTVIDTPAKAERRERTRERAWDKGLEACEVCGRALVGQGAEQIQCPTSGSTIRLGPTCSKRLAKWLNG